MIGRYTPTCCLFCLNEFRLTSQYTSPHVLNTCEVLNHASMCLGIITVSSPILSPGRHTLCPTTTLHLCLADPGLDVLDVADEWVNTSG
jgi:hypothetical protein